MDFNILLPGQILFGPGRLSDLPQLISSYGKKVLMVTGRSSFLDSEKWPYLSNRLYQDKLQFEIVRIPGEPSPAVIDETAREYRSFAPDVVVSIGGGSVLDAGKAISAMIPIEGNIRNYLEGVGDGSIHTGTKIPFIAIPTTAGTGSEATKNAVISEVGANGFKKSLRHNNFIPDVALIDAELTLSSAMNTTAWSGMDAFTQLLESYLSTASNPMTDAIAWSGLEHISQYLERVVEDGYDLEARTGMAYAALCSGITLANAGLGVIHGFASSIGGLLDIPHGLICASLMGVANEITFNKLIKENPDNPYLRKYAKVGKLWYGSNDRDEVFYAEFLINKIHDLTLQFGIPKLKNYGLKLELIDGIVSGTSCKNNPVYLDENELRELLKKV